MAAPGPATAVSDVPQQVAEPSLAEAGASAAGTGEPRSGFLRYIQIVWGRWVEQQNINSDWRNDPDDT